MGVRRILWAVAVALVMALMLATTALADRPVADPNCTFEKGKTTCITTEESHRITSVWVQSTWVYCVNYFTSERQNQQ